MNELVLNIMKKIVATLFGIALFVAGTAYTHRQSEYVAKQKQTLTNAGGANNTLPIRPQLRNTVTYQLVSNR